MTTNDPKQLTISPIDGKSIVTRDPWMSFREFTDARIALGRCGSSMPLASVLELRLTHARAKDAVTMHLESDHLKAQLSDIGLEAILLQSATADRTEYLKRPDLGRCLDAASLETLALRWQSLPFDIVLVIGDGLSARAIHESAIPFVAQFADVCATRTSFRLGPVSIVTNCRVATGDEIGEVLRARIVVVLIGERPGLSSPNSMGIYLTYSPQRGLSDEARNCISNIRPGGLPLAEAVRKLAYLIEGSFRLNASGVTLKDRMAADYLPFQESISITT
jgi:ethanolamine ammonia-lyase small subunit